jgi:uncharacterized linocin/CFP29 family protein
MDILRRSASLITPEAWQELDGQAKKVLTAESAVPCRIVQRGGFF